MDVRLPNGKLIKNVPEGTSKEEIQFKAVSSGLANEADFQPKQPVYDPTEGMSTTEKVLAGVGSGMVDIGYGVGQLLGLVDQESIQEKQRLDAPLMDTTAGTVGNIGGRMALAAPAVFIPGANTAVGATMIGAGLGAAEPVAQGNVLTGKLTNTATGAAFGRVGHEVGKRVGGYIAGKAAQKAQRLADQKAGNIVRDTTLAKGRQVGYTVNPTQANPSVTNRTLEGLAGKITTAQRAAEKNQAVTNKIARRSLGLPDDAPLTPETLENVRRGAGAPYEQIKQVSAPFQADKAYVKALREIAKDNQAIARDFPEIASKGLDKFVASLAKKEFSANGAIEAIKKLRFDAKALFKSEDPAKVALAKANRKAADALEDLVGRNLTRLGQPTLKGQYQEARKLIARSYTVEDALNQGSGNVVSKNLAKALNRGTPLEGDMKTAAQFAQTFPRATQEITSSMPMVSPLDFYAAGGVSAITQNPAAMAAVLARPAAREAILSAPYQRLMTQPSYSQPTRQALARLLANPRVPTMTGIGGAMASVDAKQ